MVEKPEIENAPSNLAISGRYILTPDIFNILKKIPPGKNGEIQITDALLEQAKKGKVIAYKFNGKRFDCGSIDGYIKAISYFAKKMVTYGFRSSYFLKSKSTTGDWGVNSGTILSNNSLIFN
jgi:UTP--glucose-1-phosphate uridylyltransferase